ncbi:MAG: YggT family protein [Chloroflexi bacterium]|jgi:uncharacterized protein YggT (Ycf19 family)|nr:YggT family protein [Chloroflexota bacterium]
MPGRPMLARRDSAGRAFMLSAMAGHWRLAGAWGAGAYAPPVFKEGTVSAKSPDKPSRRLGLNLSKITELIWLFTGTLEAVIAMRVLLKLIAANPEAGFADFIYNMTDVFLAPFEGLTPAPQLDGSVLEISSLIAMLVYALTAWGTIRALWIIFEESSIR